MKTIHATYENGVFHPKERVDLPEHCDVEFEPRPVQKIPTETDMSGVYAVLSRRFASGERDLAARHNEHQP